eukprot:6177764-Pleurochrysis_carterae.AAC.2
MPGVHTELICSGLTPDRPNYAFTPTPYAPQQLQFAKAIPIWRGKKFLLALAPRLRETRFTSEHARYHIEVEKRIPPTPVLPTSGGWFVNIFNPHTCELNEHRLFFSAKRGKKKVVDLADRPAQEPIEAPHRSRG